MKSTDVSAGRRRGGRPPRADSVKLGLAILKAAETEFFAQGFGGARMDAIAEAAGTTKQTLYTRYGSKEELFIAVSNAFLQNRFQNPSRPDGSLRDKLIDLADQMLDAILDTHMVRMHSIIISEAERFPELARMSDKDDIFPVRGMMEAMISDAMASGHLRSGDPHESMLMLTTMVMAHPLRAMQLGIGFPRDRQQTWARFAVNMFLDGMLPRP